MFKNYQNTFTQLCIVSVVTTVIFVLAFVMSCVLLLSAITVSESVFNIVPIPGIHIVSTEYVIMVVLQVLTATTAAGVMSFITFFDSIYLIWLIATVYTMISAVIGVIVLDVGGLSALSLCWSSVPFLVALAVYDDPRFWKSKKFT